MKSGQIKSIRFGVGAFAAIGLACFPWAGRADDYFPVLQAGSEVYSNVTVTSVTATDVYFSYPRGMGNAKLKNLSPGLQKHFHFDAVRAQEVEKSRRQANIAFREELARQKPGPVRKAAEEPDESKASDDADIVVSKLYANSFRGQRPPQIIVDRWLTPPSDPNGKFVLVEFWATWCGPCRRSIPHLNELQARFKDRLVVVGLSDEPMEKLQGMTSPHIDYAVGTDTQARTLKAVGVEGIPHALLIDPTGIVRFEGPPTFLTAERLARLMVKYSESPG
jgi:cytochrome c biogenesis protein CcmG/thiol:disulfide interchange protein DsbE